MCRDGMLNSYADGVPETGQTFMSDFWSKVAVGGDGFIHRWY
jgi:hypothetical protein